MHSYFALLLLIASAFAATCDISTCQNQGNCTVLDTCSCFSGFQGQFCQNTFSGCTWNNVDKIQTKYPYTLNSIQFAQNNLSLELGSPLVQGRLNTTIYISGSEGNTDCQYPGTNWQKSIGSCTDKFNANLRWSLARTCGTWVMDNSDPDYLTYTSRVFVKSSEITGSLRDVPIVRDLSYNYPIMVRFQKTITVSATMRSFAPIVLQAAISKQSVDVAAGTGSLELTTSVQWPFKYSNPALTSVPAGFTVTGIQELTTTTQCVADKPCLQVWSVSFTLGTNCQLNGAWVFSFSQNCHPDYTDNCPIPSAGQTDSLTTDIISEDYCALSQIDIGLVGTIQSYENNERTINKTSFLRTQIAYFTVTAASSQATLQTTTIDEIVTIQGGNNIFLWQNGAAQTAGTASSIAVSNTVTANSAQFQFVVNQNSAPVAEDTNIDYTVRVKLIVTYSENVRRTIFAEFAAPRQAKTTVKSTFRVAKTSSAATTSFSMLLVLLASVLLFLF